MGTFIMIENYDILIYCLLKVASHTSPLSMGLPCEPQEFMLPKQPLSHGPPSFYFPFLLPSHLCVALINSQLLWWRIQLMYRSQYPNTSLSLHNSNRSLGNNTKQARILLWTIGSEAGKGMTTTLAVIGAHTKILLLAPEQTPDASHPFPNPSHWSDENYHQS